MNSNVSAAAGEEAAGIAQASAADASIQCQVFRVMPLPRKRSGGGKYLNASYGIAANLARLPENLAGLARR
jgi:hypothetical protein